MLQADVKIFAKLMKPGKWLVLALMISAAIKFLCMELGSDAHTGALLGYGYQAIIVFTFLSAGFYNFCFSLLLEYFIPHYPDEFNQMSYWKLYKFIVILRFDGLPALTAADLVLRRLIKITTFLLYCMLIGAILTISLSALLIFVID